jgi:type II secretory pathway pseudopilin PulG
MIIVAYTVPRQWSSVVQRERDRQTIFLMKQYAKAIDAYAVAHGNALPVSVNQMKEAKQPRFLRGKDAEFADPLTGEVDWLIIPQSSAGAGGTLAPGTQPTSSTGTTGTQGAPTVPAIPIKDYAGGPFIGIRPAKTGKSFLELNGAGNYEQWSYTLLDYRNERTARLNAALQTFR